MKIVAVVPIKLNNRRYPNKNIKPFTNGEPLCRYILKTLLRCKQIEEIFVYCSDSTIRQYLPEGIQFIRRPESLDLDTTKMNELLKKFSNEVPADIYVMTHATSPFVSADSIEKGIHAVLTGDYDSAFAVRKMQDFMWKNDRPMNYELDNIPRTQDLEPIWQETSGFYIYKKQVINELNRRIGERPFLVEVNEIEGIDIDEKIDFEIADAVYNYFFNV